MQDGYERLSRAIETACAPYPLRDLRVAVEQLSAGYRGNDTPDAGFIGGAIDAAAYAAYRMPATYSAIKSVFEQVANRLPDWSPTSVLDIGAGTGAGLWAAFDSWPDIVEVELRDVDHRMLDFGRRLAGQLDTEDRSSIQWQTGSLHPGTLLDRADLVLASYVVNELPTKTVLDCVDLLWNATREILVILDPGTPKSFERLREVRRHLISQGARIIAPCPHDGGCPMTGGDWCHFSTRLQRSRLHRNVKPGELAYEDEKFSYIVASRSIGAPASGRVIRHPQFRKKMVELQVCGPEGLRTHRVTRRKNPDIYRQARSASWGDEAPDADQ